MKEGVQGEMEQKEFKWLPHLENSIPESAKGYSMSLYAIALEGWRRGLNLKFINENRRKSELLFELASDNKKYKFVVSRGELITSEAIRICRNKFETKKYLQNNNVPTPKGKLFEKDTDDKKIVNYANEIGYPLVIKPSDGTGGKGVIAGIKNEEEFVEALSYVRDDLGFKTVIVEDYFKGEDYRVYVIDNEVVGIIKRIPANVVGDGKSTIAQLIKEKNKLRKESPILRASLIKNDQELRNMLTQNGFKLDSIPEKNKRVFLKSKNNISAGGDPVDITDDISDKIKQVAIDGVNAVPGLPHAGVDLMVDVDSEKGTVIEINTQANIRSHLFPMIGKARDVPSKLIDFYFPETKTSPIQSLLYFDIEQVWNCFRNGKVAEYTIPIIPDKNVQATRFIISGDIQGVNYGSWVRRQARDLDLNGYVKFLENKTVSIVVAGDKVKIDHFKNTIKTSSSKRAEVSNIIEKTRTTPVKIGFEIINANIDKKLEDGYFPVRLEGISKLGQKKVSNKRKRKSNKKKENLYKVKYKQVIESKSWKITKPLRFLSRRLVRK